MIAGKQVLSDDRGMSTVEYAIGTLAAAALALLLFSLMSGDWVEGLLRGLVLRAFTVDA
ncbi:DUF4244 domain-containing protein [Actinosynnema sp. NPDC050801]|jgi:hypothetical protein|uniref:DUF4244 domain-containing protein n=1 Tax=unclassified Actinosynnema TaxID=2637065 RepID=UPI0033D4B4FF